MVKLKKLTKIRVKLSFPKLNKKSRDNLSEKLMDLGNISFGTLFISQLISTGNFNLSKATIGMIILISTYTFAIILTN